MTSTQNIAGIADSYGIFTYKDTLVYFGIEDHGNWRHRELAVRLDPYIKAYIKRFDEELLAELPVTTPDIFGGKADQEQGEKPLQEENPIEEEEQPLEDEGEDAGSEEDVNDDWVNERYSQLFIKIMDKARTHSYCVVKLYSEAPFWRVFCEREITEMYYTDEGAPTGCKVQWSRSLPKSSDFMNYEEDLTFYTRDMDLELKEETSYALFVPFKTGESEDELGEYDLEDKWSLSVFIRYCTLDVINNSAKSSGFYWLKYAAGIQDTARQSLIDALDAANRSQAVGASGNVLEEVQDIHPENPDFSITALEELRMQFAMACRLPLQYFRSESALSKAFSVGQNDESLVNKRKEHLFGQFKPYFMDLIYMRWGIELDDIQPWIVQGQEDKIEIPLMPGKEEEEGNKELNGKKMEVIK